MKTSVISLALALGCALLFGGCPNPVTDPLLSNNADLRNLAVNTGSLIPTFEAGTTAYSVSVPNDITNITITGTKDEEHATVSSNNGVPQSLNVGVNTFTITVIAEDGTTTKDYLVTVTRNGASNADLSDLMVSAGTLSPAFGASTTAYSVSVPFGTTSIAVTGTKSDNNASLSANNGVAQSLNVGTNSITITVTAQDGTTIKDYVVTVTRAGASNADLSDLALSVGTLSPAFGASTTAYNVSVPFGTTSITVTGTKSDNNASLSANNGIAQSLNVGTNSITITVTAQDGTTIKDYVVTVTRAGDNADLAALTVSAGTLSPTFGASTTSYSVIVANGTTSITVTGTMSDSNATISTNNGVAQALNVGSNIITITVTAQDGTTTKDYVVTVNRLFALTMINIPAGRFQRDTTGTNISAINTAYSMSQYEITRAQFLAVMGADPTDTTYSSGTNDPVRKINWYHAIAFCNKLSVAEGLTPVYSVSGITDWAGLVYASIPAMPNATWDAVSVIWANNGYRLPTAMEWMWAAMGAPADGQGVGTNTVGYQKLFAGSTGTNSIDDYAWYNLISVGRSHPVGTKLANELGLFDMSGNAWEWCWDWNDILPSGELVDYRGPSSGTARVIFGGSSNSGATGCTVGSRTGWYPSDQFSRYDIGFRVVRR